MTEWPKVSMSDLGCLRKTWPQEFFTFVGRYQLELEQMRKECRDRLKASRQELVRHVRNSFRII